MVDPVLLLDICMACATSVVLLQHEWVNLRIVHAMSCLYKV